MAPSATESTTHADGRVGRRIENYTQFWQKDMSKEAAHDTDNRLENYVDVINGTCYSVISNGLGFVLSSMRVVSTWLSCAWRACLGWHCQ